MKQIRKLIFLLVTIIIIFVIVYVFFKRPNLKPVKGQLDEMDLTSYNKLMVISHPEDETVYGGVHLLSDNYVVVCASCGVNKSKDEKLQKVLNKTGDKLVKLGYPENFYLRSDLRKIKKKLKIIYNYKNWDLIVTHNPDGENDNLQHKQINDVAREVFPMDRLYYFGKYYDKKKLNKLDRETTLDRNLIKIKVNNLVKIYDDKNMIKRYKHMFPFEDWIGARSWKS